MPGNPREGATNLAGTIVGGTKVGDGLNFAGAQQIAKPGTLDISQQIADQAAFNKALSDSVQGNVENVANLSRKGDELLGANGGGLSPTFGLERDAFLALAANEAAVIDKAIAGLTPAAQRGLLASTTFASTTSAAANCTQMRVLLAEGKASDEIKKIAAEKCNIAVVDASAEAANDNAANDNDELAKANKAAAGEGK